MSLIPENHVEIERLFNRAMRILAMRNHSEQELRRKLAMPFPVSLERSKSVLASDASSSPRNKIQLSNYSNTDNLVSSSLSALRKENTPSADSIEHVISRCYSYGWLDDAHFAQRYILSRSRKGYGAQRIRMELQQKGINGSLITELLCECEVNWEEEIQRVYQRKFGERLPTDWKDKIIMQRYLLNRGYYQEEIQSIYRDFE